MSEVHAVGAKVNVYKNLQHTELECTGEILEAQVIDENSENYRIKRDDGINDPDGEWFLSSVVVPIVEL